MKQTKTPVWDILFSIYAAALPFGPALPNIIMVLIITFWIYKIIRREVTLTKGDWVMFVLVNAFIVFQGISLGWSENLEYGLDKLMLMAIIPAMFIVFLGLRHQLNHKTLLRVVMAFSISVTCLCILSLLWAITDYGMEVDAITQNNLSTAFVGFHYLGFSLYTALALVLSAHYYFFKADILPRWYLKLQPILLIILTINLILLSSRITIVLTLLLILPQVTVAIIKRHNMKLLIATILVVLGAIGFIAQNSVLMEKFRDAVNYQEVYSVDKYWGGRGFRELIWNCSYYLIKENPVVGTGFGDQQDEMELCYKKHRYNALLLKGNIFNAHNLFLQVYIGTGIIGILLLIMSIGYPVYLTISKRQVLYLVFVILFFGTGLTESHFNRNAAVSLFAFFNPLILFICLNYENSPSS